MFEGRVEMPTLNKWRQPGVQLRLDQIDQLMKHSRRINATRQTEFQPQRLRINPFKCQIFRKGAQRSALLL